MQIAKYPEKGRISKEGVVVKWALAEGQTVKNGDLLLQIEAAGELIEIECGVAGTVLKAFPTVGCVVKSGEPLAIIGQKGEDVTLALQKLEQQKADTTQSAAPVQAKLKAKEAIDIQPVESQSKKEDSMTTPQSTGNPDNVIPILMPQAGQSMEEGTILSWKIKEGDTIEIGQIIMEIETDKATMEVEAADAGRVAKIVAGEGDIVEVKVPVAYLAEEGVDMDAYIGSAGGTSTTPAAAIPAPTSSVAKSAPTVQKTPTSVSSTGRVKASPAARKIADEKGLDLASIGTGSGPGGRILSSDVENADVVPTETRIRPLTKMRRAIANNLLYSKQNVPHFYAKTTIDATSLFSTYRKTKEQFKCTINDFVTYACAKAIRQYPEFRSQYKGTEIIENPSTNIGIAVGTDQGLTVPVVVGADRMKLEQLAVRTREVVESARNGKLEGMGQGIFTITNLGMFGVEEFSAIINPPESAILAVGAVREGVVVENGAMRAGRLMTVTVSVDHRVIDGVVAAQFLKTLKEFLEDPGKLVS
ncbi:MAG: 2-oxo acid dehydrogenase subunit E2 [Phycisphaerae bacterium]|nr:2-oxo acid dehydrogenase subunit E2 [Phycisphaerae bacterium]